MDNNSIQSFCVEVKTGCKHCGQTIPLNALVDDVVCSACNKHNEYPYDYWRETIISSVFEERISLKDGEGSTSTIMSGEYEFKILYGKQKARCSGCKTSIDLTKVDGSDIKCSSCGNFITCRVIPDNLKNIFKGVHYLIGEDKDMLSNYDASSVNIPVTAKPVIFTCPSCGGHLKIDGKDRMVNCEFCNSQIYLPDDLWLRLHPAKTVERWYLIFDDNFLMDYLPDWENIADVGCDKNGNIYVASTMDDDEDFILWSMSPDRKMRWIKKDLKYNYEYSRFSLTDNNRLYLWSTDKDSILIISTHNGTVMHKIEPGNSSGFSIKGCSTLIADKDNTILAVVNDRFKRYRPDGSQAELWSEAGNNNVGGSFIGFLSKVFGSFKNSGIDSEYAGDTADINDKPQALDGEYNPLSLGWDGYIYIMDTTSSDDSMIAKYDSSGNRISEFTVLLDYKEYKSCIDKYGNIFILGKKNELYNLFRLTPGTKELEPVIKHLAEGGYLSDDEDKFTVTPEGIIYLFGDDSILKIFDKDFNPVFISDKARENDEEWKTDNKEKE